uniref:Uncharacterized protein n=1 Tax=Graphocephala atropunctata TaxID=36148 RepID=A0A1B6LE81_9HEMI
MVRIYTYNDLRSYKEPLKISRVTSNLCTWYYDDKKKFCGNYCSRRGVHGSLFNRRCWRHKRKGTYSASLPPVILLMISASERFYNRDTWINFLAKCDAKNVPLELVVYHEDMLNSTVRNAQNMISRYRPFPDIFGKVLPLKNSHGGINFAQTYIKMLEYGCKIPYAARCIVLTERTIPIRDPVKIYQRAISSQCYVDISFNVGYGPVPKGLPKGLRNKDFVGVNNLCQGLLTTEFLKLALPTVPMYCNNFGITLNNGVYKITDLNQFEAWRAFTGSNHSEFWLLNSYMIHIHGKVSQPVKQLKQYMEKTVESDKYTVAEVPQWREGWKRTFVFTDAYKRVKIPLFDSHIKRYYRDLPREVSLVEIVRFIRRYKRRALFFRQVELP